MGLLFVLNLDQRVQGHWPARIHVNIICLVVRFRVFLWVKSINFELLYILGCACSPHLSLYR